MIDINLSGSVLTKRVLSISAAILVAVNMVATPAYAQPVPEKLISATPTDSTYTLEQQSVSLMRRGKRLENAITSLFEAVRREPTNCQHTILLACAQAERAHTLADAIYPIRLAASRSAERKANLEEWEKIRQDRNNPFYNTPKPTFTLDSSDYPRTSDDDKPTALTAEQAKLRVRELSESSLSLLEKAAQLSAGASPKEQAENAFLSGWIALVLWHGPRRIVPESWPKQKEKPEEQEGPKRVFAYLEKAVDLAPENTDYALGLADACLIASVDQSNPSRPPTRFDKELFERGKAALTKAAKRRPNDGALWFYIASLEGVGAGDEGKGLGLWPRTPENLAALRRATTTFPSNALVWYTLAAAQSSLKDDVGALESIVRGNDATSLKPVRYETSAPTLMSWVFRDITIQYPMQPVLLLLSLGRTGDEGKRKGNNDTVLRTAQTALQMSKQYETALNEPDLTDADKSMFRVNSMVFKNFASGFPKLPPSSP
jgi:hypothetical protein